jgi:hypothetical protein
MHRLCLARSFKGSRAIPSIISFIVIWIVSFIIFTQIFQPSTHNQGVEHISYANVVQKDISETMYLSSATGPSHGSVKLYIHDPAKDPWLSGQIAESGVYNKYATQMLFGILDKMLLEG